MIADWWVYIVVILGGWLATDIWRWLGVLVGNKLDDEPEALRWVKAVATALVMAVTSKLVVFPTGSLELSPLWLRIAAAALGFAAFLASGQKIFVGVLTSIAILVAGLLLLGASL